MISTLILMAGPFLMGYLMGSIPFGLLLTRAAGLGDIRNVGSGNIGATNVLRTGRKGLAAATLILDALKAGKPSVSGALVASLFGVGMVFTGLVGSAVMHIDALGLVGTVFGEAALVYVVYGSVLAALGGVALYIGSLTGRPLPDVPVILLALIGFLATVLASLPHYVAGFMDQPANTAMGYSDAGLVGVANVAVALGHALMLVVVVAFVGLVVKSRRGTPSADRYQTQVSA